MLVAPDLAKPFVLYTDASKFAIGAVLCQRDNADQLHPVWFFSHTLNAAQIKYGAPDRELLSSVTAMKYFEPYLQNGLTFEWYFDAAAFQHLETIEKDASPSIGAHKLRWIAAMNAFSFTRHPIPGTDNYADVMTRPPVVYMARVSDRATKGKNPNQHFEERHAPPRQSRKATSAPSSSASPTSTAPSSPAPTAAPSPSAVPSPTAPAPARDEQRVNTLPVTTTPTDNGKRPADPRDATVANSACSDSDSDAEILVPITSSADDITRPTAQTTPPAGIPYSRIADLFRDLPVCQKKDPTLKSCLDATHRTPSKFRLENDVLLRDHNGRRQVVIPRCYRHRVLQELHDSIFGGHHGIDHTVEQAKRLVWWPGLRVDVKVGQVL